MRKTPRIVRAAVLVGCVFAAAPLLVVDASPASAATVTVSGSVWCANGAAVEGVWVASTGGGSNYATFARFGGAPYGATYSRAVGAGSISLHVGCGGSASAWAVPNYSTSSYAIGGSRVLNAKCSGSVTNSATGHGSCSWPAAGTAGGGDNFDHGYCTDGAAQKWHAYTGHWPGWTGDAHSWSTTAVKTGNLVQPIPTVDSVIVFQDPTPFGHVAWVTGVTANASGATISYVQMNGGTIVNQTTGVTTLFNQWSNGSTTINPAKSTDRFIVAPAPH